MTRRGGEGVEVAGSPWKVSSLQAQRNIKSPAFTSPSFFLLSIHPPPFPSLSHTSPVCLNTPFPPSFLYSPLHLRLCGCLLPLTAPLDFCKFPTPLRFSELSCLFRACPILWLFHVRANLLLWIFSLATRCIWPRKSKSKSKKTS